MMNGVSIGIPTYKGDKTLGNMVASVKLAITHLSTPRAEIIICVNGELQKTLAIAEGCQRTDPNIIKVLSQKERGKAAAINHIAHSANYETLFILDDDIILDPNCLLRCTHLLHTSHDVKLVWANQRIIDINHANCYQRMLYHSFTLPYLRSLYSTPEQYVRGRCMCMRLSDFPGLPVDLINDDQYLNIYYWGEVQKVDGAIYYAYGVSSIREYHLRYYRISNGREQMYLYFPADRIERYDALVSRKINFKQIQALNNKEKLRFLIWRIVDFSARYSFRIWGRRHYNWNRNTHDHHN